MQTTPTAVPARPAACTPLQAVLQSAPLAECLSADFKKHTLTFKVDQFRHLGGSYYLVPAVIGRLGIEQEQAERADTVSMPAPGKLISRFSPYTSDESLELTGQHGYAHTFYRRRPNNLRHANPKTDHWSGHLTRQDENGNSWSTQTGCYVVDNFGELVRVSA